MTSLCLPRPAHQPHALLIGGLCACSLLHVDTFLPDMHVACFCPLFTEFTVWIWISKRHLPQSPLSKRSNLTPPAPTRIPDNKLHTYLLTSQLSQWNLSFMRTGPLVTHVQVHFPQFLETCPQKKIQSALGRINEWKRTVNEDGGNWAIGPAGLPQEITWFIQQQNYNMLLFKKPPNELIHLASSARSHSWHSAICI